MSGRCRACDTAFRPDGNWQMLCWGCWRRLRAEEAKPRTVVISPVDAELLRAAVSFTHPDRHPVELHDIANRVTSALLEALKAVREAA